VRHDRVVDHGDLITAGGVTAGVDLALWIVEREFGERVADEVAQEMEWERVAAVQAASSAT
jgi:transcriptional regulator GlxA family with amidase domain